MLLPADFLLAMALINDTHLVLSLCHGGEGYVPH